MKNWLKVFLVFVLIISIMSIISGCGVQSSDSSIVSVKSAVAEKSKMQAKLDVAGVLVPSQSVNIACKISGQVLSVGFDVGNSVKAGDILVTLETKTLNAQLQQAEAALQTAQAASQSVHTQAEQAKINYDTAQKNYERTKALFDSGAVSQSQMDDVTSKRDLARKQYESATGPSYNQAQASINTAKANINSIKVQLENATITSPIDGVITNRNINTGEVASPGVILLTIADTSSLKLKGTVSQEALPKLKSGQDIDVSVDIFRGQTFKGQISNIGPVAVSTGEYFPIEIKIANTGDLRAGLSAHASVGLNVEEGIIIPVSAVVQNNGQNYVFVIKDNVVSKRIVTTGLKNDEQIEVLNGLEAGEKVATTNVGSLFESMPVNVK